MSEDKLKFVKLAAFFDELVKIGTGPGPIIGPAVGRVASPTPPPTIGRPGMGATIKSVIDAVPNQKPSISTPVSTVQKGSDIKMEISSGPKPPAKSVKAPGVPKPAKVK